MCSHVPTCPPATSRAHSTAHVVVAHPEQGWSLLCNGVVLFDDDGELLPDGRAVAPARVRLPAGTEGTAMTALRCLVVDNQPATLDQLARMLRAQPSVARVSTAAESTGALRMLHHIDVDVAFIEARMPGIDGVELAWLTARGRHASASTR